MLPHSVVISVVWVIVFLVWFDLGIPLGPGYPPAV
ncbi:AbgT family transporter [Ornithinimicrobium sp. LYQ103]